MKTKVYFNNSCSICRTEINQYKKHSGNNIEWVDISSCSDASKDTKKILIHYTEECMFLKMESWFLARSLF